MSRLLASNFIFSFDKLLYDTQKLKLMLTWHAVITFLLITLTVVLMLSHIGPIPEFLVSFQRKWINFIVCSFSLYFSHLNICHFTLSLSQKKFLENIPVVPTESDSIPSVSHHSPSLV